MRDEAERLNNDIQNLLDATRISSDGIKPHVEWADPEDIINSAIERCRHRLTDRRVVLNLPPDLPLVHVDPVLVQQALVQIFDNAAKYSPSRLADFGGGARPRRPHDPQRQRPGRGPDRRRSSRRSGTVSCAAPRHAATTSGSGLGLWIASAFIAANGGKMNAVSDGPGLGTTVSIELPVTQAAVPQMESDADE